MKLFRELKHGRITLPSAEERIQRSILEVLTTFSSHVLDEILETYIEHKSLFSVLQSNTLFVSAIDKGNKTVVYSYIFCNTETDTGIHFTNFLDPEFNLVKQMREIELNIGEVIFGFELPATSIFPLNIDSVNAIASDYVSDVGIR